MQDHLQSLVSHGFMTVMELVAYRMPEDPTSPAPVEGYVVAFVVFYKWGFGVSSHRFPRSPL
jgi:hypothetical protein